MKRSRFAQEQIINVLRQQEAGARTEEVCRRHGIGAGTLYKWKAKFGGLEASDAKRLRSLEDENRKLKKLLAESMLDNAALKDLLAKNLTTPRARRAAAEKLMARSGMSQRRAARLVGCDPKTLRREPDRCDDHIHERLRHHAAERRRLPEA